MKRQTPPFAAAFQGGHQLGTQLAEPASDAASMPEPTSPRNHSPWTHAADARLELKPSQLNGPSANQLKREQAQETLSGGIAGMFTSAAQQGLGDLAQAMGGVSGGACAALAGPGATFAAMVEGYVQSVYEADALNEAHRRDAVTQAVLWLGSAKLPADFVQSQQVEYRAAGGQPGMSRGPTDRLITAIVVAGEYDEAKRLAEQQVGAGRRLASRLGIDSPAALQRVLDSDRSFATLYNAGSGTAFRLGVESVIYQAQHPARQTQPDAGAQS